MLRCCSRWSFWAAGQHCSRGKNHFARLVAWQGRRPDDSALSAYTNGWCFHPCVRRALKRHHVLMRCIRGRLHCCYFFLDFSIPGCIRLFMLGAAAMVFGFSFFGFFFSRFPRCSPLAMVQSSGLRWVNRCIDDCCCSLEV